MHVKPLSIVRASMFWCFELVGEERFAEGVMSILIMRFGKYLYRFHASHAFFLA
jgi:hypothetical protein